MSAGLRIEIRGTVQGVGFRPWVARLARDLGVGGTIRNDARGVSIEAFADETVLSSFVERCFHNPTEPYFSINPPAVAVQFAGVAQALAKALRFVSRRKS